MTKPIIKPSAKALIHGMNLTLSNAYRLYGDAVYLFHGTRYASAAALLTIIEDEIEKIFILNAMHYAEKKHLANLWKEFSTPSTREFFYLDMPEIVEEIKKGKARYLYTEYEDQKWIYPSSAIEMAEVENKLKEIQGDLLDCNNSITAFCNDVLV